jgi:hypothetical protein
MAKWIDCADIDFGNPTPRLAMRTVHRYILSPSAIVRFVWLKFVEKPQRSVIFRKIPEGGLSLIEPCLFYKSLFLCPLFNTLTGPESPERSLLRCWMAKKITQRSVDRNYALLCFIINCHVFL